MCTGLEIAALAAVAGGSYLQYDSQKSAQEDQQKAAMAEAMRQGKMDEDKFKNFQEALADVGREDQQGNIDNATTEIEGKLSAAVGGPDASYESSASSNTPRVVKQYADDRKAESDDFVSLLGNARARQGAWGENQFDFGQKLLERQFTNNQLQTNMDRSAQIGAMEAEYAGQPGMGAVIGNGLVGLGTAGIGFAGQGGSFSSLFNKAPVSTAVPTVVNKAPAATSIGLGKNWWKTVPGQTI